MHSPAVPAPSGIASARVQKYDEMKNELVTAERLLLKNLGFMVSVQHPHKLIISFLKVLNALDSPLPQQAWNYMNDR